MRITCDTFRPMKSTHEVNVRELRNHGGRVLERVMAGETLTVVRHGRPVAELRPIPERPIPAAALLARWSGLPTVDASRLRQDLDGTVDPTL